MTSRSFALVAFSVLSVAAGCSAETTNAASSEAAFTEGENGSTSPGLATQTVVKGAVTVGETSKVAYEPDVNYAQINGIPYLAWKLTTKAATGIRTKGEPTLGAQFAIDVVGNFPGSPEVLVVDKNFSVIGQTQGTSTDLGDKASLVVDVDLNPDLILVRDMHWVAPMDFDITVTQ